MAAGVYVNLNNMYMVTAIIAGWITILGSGIVAFRKLGKLIRADQAETRLTRELVETHLRKGG